MAGAPINGNAAAAAPVRIRVRRVSLIDIISSLFVERLDLRLFGLRSVYARSAWPPKQIDAAGAGNLGNQETHRAAV
jgi:hypothetical protein